METRPPKAPPVPPWPGLDLREDRIAWAGRFPLQRVMDAIHYARAQAAGKVLLEMG